MASAHLSQLFRQIDADDFVVVADEGAAVGKGRVEQTQPMAYSADEACDVGGDTGSPASPDYGPTGNRFNGDIAWVQIDIGGDDHNHLISPEERVQIAMARQ